MASLTNTKIKDTYDGLLKTTDNDALGGTYKLITDGLGNSSGVYLGTGGNVGIGQSSPTTYKLDVNGTFRAVSTAYFESGINAASYIFHQGDTNTFFGFPANDTFTVTTSNAERMRIDSSGKVGIGTNDPAELLTVSSSDDVSIRINSTKNGTWTTNQKLGALEFFGNDSSSGGAGLKGYINLTCENTFGAAFNMNFGVGDNATDRMVITYDGNVGIGTTTPGTFKLDVAGSARSNFFALRTNQSLPSESAAIYRPATGTFAIVTASVERMRITSSGHLYVGTTGFPSASQSGLAIYKDSSGTQIYNSRSLTSSTNQIYFYNPNGLVGSISTSGSSTSYNTSSDYRLKENVVDMTGALNRIEQLEPKRFNFISDAETTVDGFIAHEVQSVIPEAVTGEKDAVDDEGNPEYQGIDQSKIVPLLVGAIKELKAEIETLKSQINS